MCRLVAVKQLLIVHTLSFSLSAALLRQATYTTARLGIYTSLFEYVSARSTDGRPPSFLSKLGIGLSAGVLGSFVGTPTEVCLIRMTADGR